MMKKIIGFALTSMFTLNNGFAAIQLPVQPVAQTSVATQTQKVVAPINQNPNAFLITAAVFTAIYIISQLGLRSYSNFVDEKKNSLIFGSDEDWAWFHIIENAVQGKEPSNNKFECSTITEIWRKKISRPFDVYRMITGKIINDSQENGNYNYTATGKFKIDQEIEQNENDTKLKSIAKNAKITAGLVTFLAIPLAILGAGALTDLFLALTWYRKNPDVKNRNIIIAGLNKIISMFGKQDNQKQPADITNKVVEAIK